MRVTFLGNFGVDYSSESHHKKSLEQLGHEVIALQETVTPSEIVYDEARNSDMFVWVHTHGWKQPGIYSMDAVLQKLKEAKVPTVTYHLDLWFGLDRQKDLENDKFYKMIDWFFTCDKKMAEWFNENTSVKGRYLPAGVFEPEMLLDPNIQKVNDIIFVGSRGYHHEWPYRPQLIDWLGSTYGNRFKHIGGDGIGVVRGHALTGLYNATKVAVGDSLNIGFDYPYYWSDRLYESVGRGGFTIFPYIKGLENEFKLDRFTEFEETELVTYDFGDFNGLKTKIDFYLQSDDSREQIRKRGFERAKKDHTYSKRWETIIKEVGLNEHS